MDLPIDTIASFYDVDDDDDDDDDDDGDYNGVSAGLGHMCPNP